MNDYFDRIEQQLVARTQARAGAGIMSRTGLIIRRPSLGTVTAVLAVVAAVATAGAFMTLAAHRAPRPGVGSTNKAPAKHARPIAGSLQSAFPVLRRPRTAADVVPARVVQGLSRIDRKLGLDFRRGRVVLTTAAVTIWLVPGRGWLCAITADDHSMGGGGGCVSVTNARKVGFMSRSQHTLVGVLPVGSSAVLVTRKDGSVVKLTPNQAGVVRLSSAQSLSGVTWTGPDGVNHHLPAAQRVR